MMTKRSKAISVLAGVFLLGGLCGALALGAFMRNEVRSMNRLRDSAGFQNYFVDKLELTAAQRDSLQDELDWFYHEFAGLRSAAEGEFHELIDSMDRRLVSHLSPEQIRRLRKTEQKLRRQMAIRRRDPLAEPAVNDAAQTPTVDSPIDSTLRRPNAPSSKRVGSAKESASQSDSLDRIDTSSATPDPGPAFTRFGDRLKERLELSDVQLRRIQGIIDASRTNIRRDVREMKGLPRMQLEIASKHLRQMDRDIMAVLDPEQRIAYEPIRAEIASRIRSQLVRHLKNRRVDRLRGKRGTSYGAQRGDNE